MFIIVDERDLVTNGYACRFGQEGIASTGFRPGQFRDWVATAVEGDVLWLDIADGHGAERIEIRVARSAVARKTVQAEPQ